MSWPGDERPAPETARAHHAASCRKIETLGHPALQAAPIVYNGRRRHRGMSGKTVRVFAVSVLLMAGGMQASAETATPTENVTVTATKLREEFHEFLKAFVTPTKVTGKI